MRLDELGWNERFAKDFDALGSKDDVQPARVGIGFNHIYRVYVEAGEFDATLAGRFKHQVVNRSELPAVGDWVAVRKQPDEEAGAILAVLPRRTRFSRKAAGNLTDEQVVAANVDVVFIVMALDQDFNLRRLERYLLLARESGADPVILLTKLDLCADIETKLREVATLSGALPVHVLSPKLNEGIALVAAYLTAGRTAALLGSSGVGKTTIINRLAGDEARKTREVREADSRGRHTTTHRELVVLPGGGLIIDTPGMRELQLWDVGDAVRETFDDIELLAPQCHFTACRHIDEPRCAVKAAVADGGLAAERLASYVKLMAEVADLDEKRRLKPFRAPRKGSR